MRIVCYYHTIQLNVEEKFEKFRLFVREPKDQNKWTDRPIDPTSVDPRHFPGVRKEVRRVSKLINQMGNWYH